MARDEAPSIWGDDADDELIVTRESLAGARSDEGAKLVEPSPNVPRASSEQPPAATAPHVAVAWASGLTLRQKALRGGAMGLLIALTLYLLLGGPAATPGAFAALNAWLHPPKPQPTLAERGYVSIKSPPDAYNLPGMSVAPVAGHADAAWTCWASPYTTDGKPHAWTAHAYYTGTSGARWSALALPETAAQGCAVDADSERAASALYVLTQGQAPDGSCIAPFLYLTTDTGASWTHVPWPLGPSDGACSFTTALQGGAIYVWSDKPIVRGTNAYTPPTGRLIVTRDSGQTWALADNGLDDSAGLTIVGFRPGGRILATTADVRTSGSSSTLMMSDDYGATWRSLGDLPGAFPQIFVSTDNTVTDHGGWGRLYELAETETNGLPTVPQTQYLATAYIGQGWTPVPLPPLPSGSAVNAQSREPLVIGLGPAGSLEVERGVVDAANAQLSPSRRLWVWNPAQRIWLLDPQAIPGNLELQGATWRTGDQIFWMTTLQLGVPPILQIYTKVYPADFLTRIQPSTPAGA